MTDTTGTFRGVRGTGIHWRRIAPETRPRGVVLLSHGYAEHVDRYLPFMRHLAGRGVAVVGVDHRGHGRSEGPRGHARDFDEFVADLRVLADHAEAWWPGSPRVLFGHSMGGVIGFLYLLRHPTTVRAGALSGPAFRVFAPGPAWQLRLARALGRWFPRLPFKSGLDEAALSRDPAVGKAYVADPLVHRRATAGFIRAFGQAQERAFTGAPSLQVPVLILQGDADRLVDPAGAREMAARLPASGEVELLPGYYHELLNEPEPERARVVERLDRWFERWLS